MTKCKSVLAATLGVALTACTTVTTTDTGSIPVTRDFEGISLGWEREDSETIFLYLARDRGGMTEVCGAIFTKGTNSVRALEPRVKERIMLRGPEGTLILNSVRHFSRVDPNAAGQRANCAVTAVPWNPAWEETPPVLDSRRLTFEV